MPAYVPAAAELDREMRLVNDPRWRAEVGAIGGLLDALRRSKGDEDLRAVHGALLAALKSREGAVAEVRERVASARDRRTALAQQTPKPVGEIRATQQEISALEQEEQIHLALHVLLLDVGDAMAWRRLHYDRAAITALSQGDLVGWLSEGSGWESELRALEEVRAEGALALINDATTCLRYGDITCFFPDRTELREVKAGKAASKDSSQMRRLATVVDFINSGRGEFDGQRRALLRSPRPYRTHLTELEGILRKAQDEGLTAGLVSPTQFVVARSLVQDGGAPPFPDEDATRLAGWPEGDVVLRWGSTLRRMRDRRRRIPFLAPLTLLPIPVDLLVWVLFGALDYSTWVNVTAIARDLLTRGYDSAEPLAPPKSGDGFIRVGLRRGNSLHELTVAPHLRETMAIELMTTETLAAMVETTFGSAPIPDERTLVVASDEARVWERS